MLAMSCQRASTDLDLLVGLVNGGHLVLLVQRGLVTEEAHQVFVSQAEELDLLVVLAGVIAPLSIQNGIKREGGIALDNIGQLEAGRKKRIGESPSALGAIPCSVRLLAAPVLRDALPAEVVLATEADGILVDAEADRTEQLVLQATSHLKSQRPSCADVDLSSRRLV